MSRAFGEENRRRHLDRYFQDQPEFSFESAWRDVYTLLLCIDRTTGLARCYESDKSQPGRPWYARTLRFHEWLTTEFGTAPNELAKAIDWLFRMTVGDLELGLRRTSEARLERSAAQFEPYASRQFPKPGTDPQLVRLIREPLAAYLVNADLAPWPEIVSSVSTYVSQENKRKNLTGEGFEDLLASLLRRCGVSGEEIFVRRPTAALPGFASPQRAAGKPKEIDLAVLRGRFRMLVSAKWSVRADREEQFRSDYEHYKVENAVGEPFDYVLVTNEFDPARLVAACDSFVDNRRLFSQVVHIAPPAVIAAYGTASPTSTMRKVQAAIESGRLISLGSWLAGIKNTLG